MVYDRLLFHLCKFPIHENSSRSASVWFGYTHFPPCHPSPQTILHWEMDNKKKEGKSIKAVPSHRHQLKCVSEEEFICRLAQTNGMTSHCWSFQSLVIFTVTVRRLGGQTTSSSLYSESIKAIKMWKLARGCIWQRWNRSGENKHFEWGRNDESRMCIQDDGLFHWRNGFEGQRESGSNWRAGLLQSRVISKRWDKAISTLESLAQGELIRINTDVL